MVKKIIILIVIIFILFSSLLLNIYYYPKSNISENIKSFFPVTVKTFVRDYFFILPEKNNIINNLEIFSLQNINEKNNIEESKMIQNFSKEILNENYELTKYLLPFYNRELSNKTVAHIDTNNQHTYIVTGNGEFYFLENKKLFKKEIQITKIKNNLTDIILDLRFYDYSKIFLNSDEISVKDIFINEGNIYVSYIKEVLSNCFNTSLLVADLNNVKLDFKPFYTYDDCLSFKYQEEFNAQQSGGRITRYKDSILFTIGEYRNRTLAQDPKSNFGKIIKININDNSKSEIFSMGHRNPQGLLFDTESNIILSTEHGPLGGDEINLIKPNKNYGWPLASYGNHYNGKFRKEAPLYKSHKKYGFEEPLFYFDSSFKSLGVSEIINISKYSKNLDRYYFVSSLAGKTLFLMKLNNDKTELKILEKIKIGERTRDIIYIKQEDLYLLVLENSPALGFLKIKNNF